MGNPIDDATQQRINDRIKEVLATFGTEFSKAYTQVVINNAKAELTPESSLEDELKLEEAPLPEQPLKTGMLIKRGDVNKNWKNRFFIAYNAKDNYRIDYLDGTDEKGKVKGSINCAGYYATEFNSDDIAEYGEAGIKLVPWSYRRRTWFIKCGDAALRNEWMDVFRTACWKARPPCDENATIAEAFDIALRNTRWKCWIWGWYYGAGTEAERLGELLLDVLDRDIINEVIGNIIEGPAKSLTVDLIRKTIGSTVNAACSSAWLSSAAAVRSVSDKIQSQVKDLMNPIVEKQNNLKEMIVGRISSTIDPFLADKGSALFTPVLRIVFRPIIRAFTEAAKGFHKHVAQLIKDSDFSGDRFRSTLNRLDWQMDWWSGPVGEAYQIIYRMYTSDLNEIMSILAGGSSSMIYNMCMDKLKLILHRAVFTFGARAGETSGADLNQVLSHVTGLLFHDCYIMVQSTVKEILNGLISPMITENVINPAGALIAPLQETIDSIPIPGLSVLLDLNALLEETVGDITDNALTAVLSGSLNEVKSALNDASLEVGVSAISF